MPITSSAKKALRQSERRRVRNRVWKEKLKDAVKPRRQWVGAPIPTPTGTGHVGAEASEKAAWLSNAYKIIDKSAKKGLIKKNKAARMKSRLAKLSKA